MRRKVEILLVLTLVMLLTGCSKAPIKMDKMEDILFDIYRTDACISVERRSMPSEERVKYYDSIFKKHGVTKEEFDEALDWYAHHPRDWELVYQNLTERTEEYVKRVENYEFSPKDMPDEQSNIDSIDLWMPKNHWKWRADDGKIDRRQTDFTLDDRKFFLGAQQVRFCMNMRCWSDNAADSVTTMMVLRYSKGATDTLRYKAPVDSAERIYTMTKKIPDGRGVSMVRVQIIDTVVSPQGIDVSNVSLKYTFDAKNNKMPGVQRNQLYEMQRELRDEKSENPSSFPLLRAKDGTPLPVLKSRKK